MPERTVRDRSLSLSAFALLSLSAFLVGIFCYFTGITSPLDNELLRYGTQLSARNIDSDVVVVEIDARSIHELGAWPWPRGRHATLIDVLRKQGAKRVFIDIDFSAPSTPTEDALLVQALRRAPGLVVLPQFWQPLSVDSKPLLLSEPLPELRPYSAVGSVNLTADADGLVRQIPDLNASDPTSAPPVWRRLTGADPGPALELDFRIAPTSYTKYSYCDLVQGVVTPDLRGKTVLVGATAIELGDIVPVPVYRSLPGILVQATAYESGRRPPLRRVPGGAATMLLAVAALLGVYFMTRRSWRALPWSTAVMIGVSLSAMYLAYAAFNLILVPAPLIAVVLWSFAGVVLHMLYTETWRSWRAARRLRQHDVLLRQIVHRSADALFTLDSNGVIRTANEATERLFGQEAGAIPNVSLSEISPELSALIAAVRPDEEIHRAYVELQLNQGRLISVEVSARCLDWEESSVVVVTLHDVSAQRRREEELRHRATHDGLTGLANRLKLMELLATEIELSSADRPLRLLMLDLDGFKEVNDTLGRDMGDALLVALATRFAELSARCTCIARLGGDEFAVLLTGTQATSAFEPFVAQLRAIVFAPVMIKGIPISLGATLGVATSPVDGTDPNHLLQCADLALSAAKRDRTGIESFHASMDVRSPRRLQILTSLRSAIEHDELHLLFQPKVPLSTGGRPEVEVLCRWNSASLGPVSPPEFIPLAEASDVIRPLTEWTLEHALGCCRRLHARGLPLKVAVNLSARHLQDETLPEWLALILERSGVAAEFLELEITESAIMRDPGRALGILQGIRALGITLSIDDYGTGYSSLSYLQQLSLDRLKIDRSFISGLLSNERDRLIVKSTIDLAHALNLEVIAEGIETPQQLEMLGRLGCDYAQGYLLSRPMQFEQVFEWFASRAEDSQRRVVNR
ncbi:MAG TPA: EAL domain-containing protein [Steroidobacteraceae bacterium]